MKILIIHSFWKHSAELLSEWLTFNGHRVEICNARKGEEPKNYPYDAVFNAGVSFQEWKRKDVTINHYNNVSICVDKVATFTVLKRAGVPIPKVAKRWRDVPMDWFGYVTREKVNGRRNEGTQFFNEYKDIPKDAVLYTEFHPGPYEYRIIVFNGEVVARFYKRLAGDGTWEMKLQPAKGFEEMDKQAIAAAKALGIDYVGFDVMATNKKKFVFLEANSAATMSDVVAEAITVYFNGLEG